MPIGSSYDRYQDGGCAAPPARRTAAIRHRTLKKTRASASAPRRGVARRPPGVRVVSSEYGQSGRASTRLCRSLHKVEMVPADRLNTSEKCGKNRHLTSHGPPLVGEFGRSQVLVAAPVSPALRAVTELIRVQTAPLNSGEFGYMSGGNGSSRRIRAISSTCAGEPKPMIADDTAGCDSANRTASSASGIRSATRSRSRRARSASRS